LTCEWWDLPLVQQKYHEEKACVKRQQPPNQNGMIITILFEFILNSYSKRMYK